MCNTLKNLLFQLSHVSLVPTLCVTAFLYVKYVSGLLWLVLMCCGKFIRHFVVM